MCVNGPASVPVAMVIAHHLVYLYEAVAVFAIPSSPNTSSCPPTAAPINWEI